MNEQEAVIIATDYVKKEHISIERIERVFFVPLDAFDYKPPGLTDSWVVHFRTPPPKEGQFDRLLSGDPEITIVSVNVETRKASILSTL